MFSVSAPPSVLLSCILPIQGPPLGSLPPPLFMFRDLILSTKPRTSVSSIDENDAMASVEYLFLPRTAVAAAEDEEPADGEDGLMGTLPCVSRITASQIDQTRGGGGKHLGV